MVRFRVRLLFVASVLGFALVLAHLFRVQVIDHARYRDLAEDRYRQIEFIPHNRAPILTESADPLALDRPTSELVYTLGAIDPRPAVASILSACLGVSPEEAEERLQGLRAVADGGTEVVLIPELDHADATRIRRLLRSMPWGFHGLKVRSLSGRRKPWTWFFAAGRRAYNLVANPSVIFRREVVLERLRLATGEDYGPIVDAARERVGTADVGQIPWIRLLERERVLDPEIDMTSAARIAYHPELFPGVRVRPARRRYYPEGELTASFVGTVGKLQPADLEELKAAGRLIERLDSRVREAEQFTARRDGLRSEADVMGSRGLEAFHDRALTGLYGARLWLVDALGATGPAYEWQVLPEDRPPLIVSVNLALQRRVRDAILRVPHYLGERKGSAVVLDLRPGREGQILAWVSVPSYDPNRIRDPEYFAALREAGEADPHLMSLWNRPLDAFFPPGSIFKLVTAAAALEAGIRPPESYRCDPPAIHGAFGCSTSALHGVVGDGTLSLARAIQQSCNSYFYRLGERVGSERLAAYAAQFGFVRPAGIDLWEGARRGILPSGHVWCTAIGQGSLAVTPLQVVRFVASVATERQFVVPRFAVTPGFEHPPVPFRAATARAIKEGMCRAVHPPPGDWGTASGRECGLRAYDVAVKTGTAERGTVEDPGDATERKIYLAWIAGFAPARRPEIAFVVCLEDVVYVHGGAAAIAGSVVREILESFAEGDPERYRHGSHPARSVGALPGRENEVPL